MKTLSQLYENALQPKEANGFCILKPGFTDHADEFLNILKCNDWKVIDKCTRKLTRDEVEDLYKDKKDAPYYQNLCDYMICDDCLCCKCHKDCDDPIADMKALKKKVREQWGTDEMRNAMHSASTPDDVERESCICIKECGCHGCKESLNEATLDELRLDNKNTNEVIRLLKVAFCEEMIAWYQYIVIAPFISGSNRKDVEDFYKDAGKDEYEDHGLQILDRLNILGADITDISTPESWNEIADHKFVVPVVDSIESIKQNIEAEKGAIETYNKLVQASLNANDYVTHQLAKHILGDEQEHLQDLEELLDEAEA